MLMMMVMVMAMAMAMMIVMVTVVVMVMAMAMVVVMMTAMAMVMVMLLKRAILFQTPQRRSRELTGTILFRHSNVDLESLLAHSWLCSIAGLI